MDIWRLLSAVLRRWYVFLAVLALALAGSFAVAERVDPEYTAGASVLLVPPALSAAGNPYADLGTAASAVSIIVQSGPVRGQFLSQGLSIDYQVAGVSRTAILRFTARANDPTVAVATAQALVDAASVELATRQEAAGVIMASHVRADVLEPASAATESTRSQLQAQVAVAGVGLVLAFLAALFFDDLVLLWRLRRQRRSASWHDEAAPVRRPRPGPEVHLADRLGMVAGRTSQQPEPGGRRMQSAQTDVPVPADDRR